MSKRLTGKIAAERIRLMECPRPPAGLVEGLMELGPDTSLVSDAMDELGLSGAVGASLLPPSILGRAIVGPALTVRNIALRGDSPPGERARSGFNGMAEMEAHNLAQPGDVIVIDGVAGLSNMGGVSATIAKRQGAIGAVVSGGIRDLNHSRAEGFPFWSSEITPITGKWRLQTVEINGEVEIGGVGVRPGDLVVADDTGVCFIPVERGIDVLELARKKLELETRRLEAVHAGAHIADLPRAS